MGPNEIEVPFYDKGHHYSKHQSIECENMFTDSNDDRRLTSKMYKELSK